MSSYILSAVLSSVLLNKCDVVPVSGTRIVCNLDASGIDSLSCTLRGRCIDSTSVLLSWMRGSSLVSVAHVALMDPHYF